MVSFPVHINYFLGSGSVQFSSVAQSCPTLCDPMNRSTPGLPVHHQLPEFTQTRVHRVSDAIQPSSHLILCCPLLLLPLIPPSIKVFSNESALHMRWPKWRAETKRKKEFNLLQGKNLTFLEAWEKETSNIIS